MWIVKIGGSLAADETLSHWLGVLSCYGGGNVVIVPGGGPFTDLVREAQQTSHIDEVTAHSMAMLGMEQYGLMLAGMRRDLVPVETERGLNKVLAQAGVPVWLPTRMVNRDHEIERSWSVTSDSLAAWLATRVGASELVLVKYMSLGERKVSAETLCRHGLLDWAFPRYMKQGDFRTRILARGQHKVIERMLNCGGEFGTRVIGWRNSQKKCEH